MCSAKTKSRAPFSPLFALIPALLIVNGGFGWSSFFGKCQSTSSLNTHVITPKAVQIVAAESVASAVVSSAPTDLTFAAGASVNAQSSLASRSMIKQH